MELRTLLKELFDKGFSQKQIAEFAGCSQPTIGDLANGHQKTTRFDIGLKIVELHRFTFKTNHKKKLHRNL